MPHSNIFETCIWIVCLLTFSYHCRALIFIPNNGFSYFSQYFAISHCHILFPYLSWKLFLICGTPFLHLLCMLLHGKLLRRCGGLFSSIPYHASRCIFQPLTSTDSSLRYFAVIVFAPRAQTKRMLTPDFQVCWGW